MSVYKFEWDIDGSLTIDKALMDEQLEENGTDIQYVQERMEELLLSVIEDQLDDDYNDSWDLGVSVGVEVVTDDSSVGVEVVNA